MNCCWLLILVFQTTLVASSNSTNHASILAKILKCNESLFDNVKFPDEDIQLSLSRPRRSTKLAVDRAKEKAAQMQTISKFEILLQNEAILKPIFENYKKTYRGKIIKEFENEERHFKTFSKNILTIFRHNAVPIKPTYEKGINQFTEIDMEELTRYFTGFKAVPPNVTVDKGQTLNENYENLPPTPKFGAKKKPMTYLIEGPERRKVPLIGTSNKDWRKLGAVSPVKNQFSCGASTLFAATGALESSHFIWNNGSGTVLDLSTQQLLDCIPPGEGHLGCGGNFVETTLSYMQSHGQGLDSLSPYQNEQGTCKDIPTAAKINKFYWIPKGERAMKIYLTMYGPIIGTLHVNENLLQYSSGIYNPNVKKCTGEVNHAVLIVGYGTTDWDTSHWIVKNSWGPEWGEDGYFRIPMHQDKCSIGTYSFLVTV